MRNLTSTHLLLTLFALTCANSNAFAAPAWESPLVPESSTDETPAEIETYLGALTPHLESKKQETDDLSFEAATSAHVQVLTFRKPRDFDYEFSVLVIDGTIRRVFLVSTSIDGHLPIVGIHKLTPIKINNVAFPWIASHKYGNSPMYWGINLRGGYFIHSSPHYGNLGKPASMGCIRASLPDAMEVFNTVVNEFGDQISYSIITEGLSMSKSTPEVTFLKSVLANSNMSLADLKTALVQSRREILAVSHGDLFFAESTDAGKEIPADAHARPFTGVQSDRKDFPLCGTNDCWTLYRKTPRIVLLNEPALTIPIVLPAKP